MIQNRFIIPLAMGLVALLLAVFGYTQRTSKVLKQGSGRLNPGESRVFEGVPLVEGRHYKLVMGPTSSIPLGRTSVVGATLMDDEETEIFSIEDAYWHERGTWNEGGESGSWDEQNSATEFDFRTPLTGEYTLRIDLHQTNIGGQKLAFKLEESQPFRLAEWPLLLLAFILLCTAGWVYVSRGAFMNEVLRTLGIGSKLTIEDVEYEVSRVYHYREGGEVGVEFELSHQFGQPRFLAIEIFEREWTDSEGDDHSVMYHRTLINLPLSDDEQAQLQSQDERPDGPRDVYFRGSVYKFDANNSGFGIRTDQTSGRRVSFSTQLYSTHGDSWKIGQLWVERCTLDNDEVEWGVQKALSPDAIKITKTEKFEESQALGV